MTPEVVLAAGYAGLLIAGAFVLDWLSAHTHRRSLRYRAKAHICNGCPRKAACTDSDHGREIVRPLDPWPHSEAGRFHRGISLLMVGLALLILVVEGARHHGGQEVALLSALLAAGGLAARWLARDFRAHPANFPAPTAAHGLWMTVIGADGQRPASPWAAQNRTPD